MSAEYCNVCQIQANNDVKNNDSLDIIELEPHPLIKNFLICQKCLIYYISIDKDDNTCICCGWDEICDKKRIQCSICFSRWCEKCIARNFDQETLKFARNETREQKWRCFHCDISLTVGKRYCSIKYFEDNNNKLEYNYYFNGSRLKNTCCTICGIEKKLEELKQHPLLNVAICSRCLDHYNNCNNNNNNIAMFNNNKNNHNRNNDNNNNNNNNIAMVNNNNNNNKLCSWCKFSGCMIKCRNYNCPHQFCFKCIDQNFAFNTYKLSNETIINWLQVILRFDSWECFVCMPRFIFLKMFTYKNITREKAYNHEMKSCLSTPIFPLPNANKSNHILAEESIQNTQILIPCTICNNHCNVYAIHPKLFVPICQMCFCLYDRLPPYYWVKDDDGKHQSCTWCSNNGKIVLCSNCECVFCEKCINRNLGKLYWKKLMKSDETWYCFVCDPSLLSSLHNYSWWRPKVLSQNNGPWNFSLIGITTFTYEQYFKYLDHSDWTLTLSISVLDGMVMYKTKKIALNNLERLPVFVAAKKSRNDILLRYCHIYALVQLYLVKRDVTNLNT